MIVVDGISGVGVHDLPMDAWGLDVVVSGSQVPAASTWPGIRRAPRAREAVRPRVPRTTSICARSCGAGGDQTTWTAAVSLLVGCGSPRDDPREGLHEALRGTRRLRAHAGGMQALGCGSSCRRAVLRCTAVTCPTVDGRGREAPRRLRSRSRAGCLTGKIFRIDMGDVDGFDMISAVAAVEMTLADLGQPVRIGDGTRAMIEQLHKSGFRKV
jgi:aspartate aminotransferase-like enzyme